MGSVGPIGYPGPKGLKVREQLSCVSSCPFTVGLKIVPALGDHPERKNGQQ